MAGKIRVLIAWMFLMMYVLSNAGCAAGWFLAGAGATAATIAVVNNEKTDTDPDDE